jgi:hypothetical protein
MYRNHPLWYYALISANNITMANEVEGYCMKCKAKQKMANTSKVEMKPGRFAMKGTCSKCNTGMYKILGKDAK